MAFVKEYENIMFSKQHQRLKYPRNYGLNMMASDSEQHEAGGTMERGNEKLEKELKTRKGLLATM